MIVTEWLCNCGLVTFRPLRDQKQMIRPSRTIVQFCFLHTVIQISFSEAFSPQTSPLIWSELLSPVNHLHPQNMKWWRNWKRVCAPISLALSPQALTFSPTFPLILSPSSPSFLPHSLTPFFLSCLLFHSLSPFPLLLPFSLPLSPSHPPYPLCLSYPPSVILSSIPTSISTPFLPPYSHLFLSLSSLSISLFLSVSPSSLSPSFPLILSFFLYLFLPVILSLSSSPSHSIAQMVQDTGGLSVKVGEKTLPRAGRVGLNLGVFTAPEHHKKSGETP